MMMYERNIGPSLNHTIAIRNVERLVNFDCHSMALNESEAQLLLVGQHELAFVNFENIMKSVENSINDGINVSVPSPSHIRVEPLFDTCNINRPVVQWNHSDTNQCAVAIDRLVRFYTVGVTRIQNTDTIIDSQHQVRK
jgi:hypothetical protein